MQAPIRSRREPIRNALFQGSDVCSADCPASLSTQATRGEGWDLAPAVGGSFVIAGAQLTKQCLFLVGQRVLEPATFEEILGGADRHDFHHIQISGTVHTAFYQGATDTASLELSMHSQALEFGQFGAIDFDG